MAGRQIVSVAMEIRKGGGAGKLLPAIAYGCHVAMHAVITNPIGTSTHKVIYNVNKLLYRQLHSTTSHEI